MATTATSGLGWDDAASVRAFPVSPPTRSRTIIHRRRIIGTPPFRSAAHLAAGNSVGAIERHVPSRGCETPDGATHPAQMGLASNLRSDPEAVRRHTKNVLRDQAVL